MWKSPHPLTLVGMDINPPDLPPGAFTRLDTFLLGRFAVAIDGVELPGDRWPSLRAAQLVQLLCLQPRQRLTRDEVIDALLLARLAQARKASQQMLCIVCAQAADAQRLSLALWDLGAPHTGAAPRQVSELQLQVHASAREIGRG